MNMKSHVSEISSHLNSSVVICRGLQSLNTLSFRPNPNFNAFMAWPRDQPSSRGVNPFLWKLWLYQREEHDEE